MKFPELFSHCDPDALEHGLVAPGCFGNDGKEYQFDYTKVPESEKREGESVVDTLTRLAKENENCANVEIDWYNTLWPEYLSENGKTILVMWAGWKENASKEAIVEHGMIQGEFTYHTF